MSTRREKRLIVASAIWAFYVGGVCVGLALGAGKSWLIVAGVLVVTAFLLWVPHALVDFMSPCGGAPTQEGE